jgi:hypothetical protein
MPISDNTEAWITETMGADMAKRWWADVEKQLRFMLNLEVSTRLRAREYTLEYGEMTREQPAHMFIRNVSVVAMAASIHIANPQVIKRRPVGVLTTL